VAAEVAFRLGDWPAADERARRRSGSRATPVSTRGTAAGLRSTRGSPAPVGARRRAARPRRRRSPSLSPRRCAAGNAFRTGRWASSSSAAAAWTRRSQNSKRSNRSLTALASTTHVRAVGDGPDRGAYVHAGRVDDARRVLEPLERQAGSAGTAFATAVGRALPMHARGRLRCGVRRGCRGRRPPPAAIRARTGVARLRPPAASRTQARGGARAPARGARRLRAPRARVTEGRLKGGKRADLLRARRAYQPFTLRYAWPSRRPSVTGLSYGTRRSIAV
jgi:hypothetical protein